MELAHLVVDILEEKRAESILLLDIQEIASFADYFIICTGTSERMLDSLGDAVLEKVKEKFSLSGKLEGTTGDGWLLIDLGDVIVHLFSAEQRKYYHLEDLWNQGKVVLHLL